MQTLTRMNKVVIKDEYHMEKTNKNVNWMKLTTYVIIFSL